MSLSDFQLTTLQRDGSVNVRGASVADVYEACDTLGIDPRETRITTKNNLRGEPSGWLLVLEVVEKPQEPSGSSVRYAAWEENPPGRTEQPLFPPEDDVRPRANLGSLEHRVCGTCGSMLDRNSDNDVGGPLWHCPNCD